MNMTEFAASLKGLDNKKLAELAELIKKQRAENIRENKRIAAGKKAEAEAKRAAKTAEMEKATAPLTELLGTAQGELFAQRVAKTTRPVLAWLAKEYEVDGYSKMKVAELRNAMLEIFKIAAEDALREAA